MLAPSDPTALCVSKDMMIPLWLPTNKQSKFSSRTHIYSSARSTVLHILLFGCDLWSVTLTPSLNSLGLLVVVIATQGDQNKPATFFHPVDN